MLCHPKSIHADRLRPREWKRMAAKVEFDVFERDLDTERQTESLFKTSGEARRKTEVNVRRLDKESNQLFDRAKSDEKNHWISNGVGRICG